MSNSEITGVIWKTKWENVKGEPEVNHDAVYFCAKQIQIGIKLPNLAHIGFLQFQSRLQTDLLYWLFYAFLAKF